MNVATVAKAAVLCVLSSGCGTDEPARVEGQRELPTIILVSIDTLRQDHVSAYGYERETTPNLDALATESILFERAYTTMSWTLIAHMSLLTGLYPSQHRVWEKDAVLPDAIPALAERLKERGYHTLGFYFRGWIDPRHGFARGFDHFESHESAAQAEQNVFTALAERPRDKPLFLFIHLFDTHSKGKLARRTRPYDAPDPFATWFQDDVDEVLAGVPLHRLWDDASASAPPEVDEAIVALYDGAIRYVDDRLGSWIERWRAEGLFEDALTIVTSDHGEGLHQRGGRYGGHGGVMEEGLLVPLIVRLPGARFAGTRVAEPVSIVDVVPTVLDIVFAEEDPRLPGHSLAVPRPGGSVVFAEREHTQVWIQWPWKVVERKNTNILVVRNLADDPLELAVERVVLDDVESPDTIPSYGPARSERARWHSFESADRRAPAMTAEEAAALAAMGYAGELEESTDDD